MFQEIKKNIIFIEGKRHGKYPYSNSVLILGQKENILIDTGMGLSRARKILKNFSINKILLSHCHEDHTSCCKYFKSSKILVHKLDKENVESISNLQKLYGLNNEKYDAIFKSFMLSLGYREINISDTFDDGQIFDLGNLKIQVIHTPGHSAGHCCFLIYPNLMFLSDIDLTSFGPWYGATDGNIDNFINSIKKIIKFNPKIAISSHKGVFYNGIREKLKIFLSKFEERDQKILENLKQKKTLDGLTNKLLIYGKNPNQDELLLIAEKFMIKKHLERLIKNKKIQKKDDFYSLI
ncbi:MAG: MBL fold metallo-hydrolase [Candidatus Helarchaeota archaeon]